MSLKAITRWLALVVLAFVALQLFFVLRVALMVVVDPESTTFQRSQAWQQLTATTGGPALHWRQEWVPYAQISDSLKRAVVAAEDDGFVNHEGVDWTAIEKNWDRNNRMQELAEKRMAANPKAAPRAIRIRGGSTITQQLAKNLLLSGERSMLRKGQELVLAMLLEQFLSKQRILEIYLNNVEWGDGVFGAQAAARRYYNKNANQLGSAEAARLAVMLPAPKRFEKQPQSAYLNGRTRVIMGRMNRTELP
ncbi:monofunctional biosynthetic peptidoglycan transglycosylase [Diaphorobacter aerolatus]|uniref:Biosynthetic peptidoglycan transglycosylase n=1 Tax=Diaphorobacter aerolatus TaxID=1288495 RepID=A0A7H0GHH6_9BURK|nr:monofunctional biosynthetic peptidoglycan transglycosylase [Diaphorobacter aerolatus]QNP47742.1 monofunctional biosynthetic peptidoglycan transglycosylase [Diaphorobacter aerolatus]